MPLNGSHLNYRKYQISASYFFPVSCSNANVKTLSSKSTGTCNIVRFESNVIDHPSPPTFEWSQNCLGDMFFSHQSIQIHRCDTEPKSKRFDPLNTCGANVSLPMC